MNLFGVMLGLSSFLSIGFFHPIVIYCEYYFTYRIWPVFLALGLTLLYVSLHTSGLLVSAVLGVIGFSCLWSIVELFQQKKRVERGWFKANPRHRRDPAAPPQGAQDAPALEQETL